MQLPIPNLDDRRFDDLVEELRTRLGAALPELTKVSPGDPVNTFVDLFAWLTETILYRANLIPERQRRAFLNLLQIPVRGAKSGRGVICVDAGPTSLQLPSLIKDGAQFTAKKQSVTGIGELQPTNLSLQVAIKEETDSEALSSFGITLDDLHEQFGLRKGEYPTPFRPRIFQPATETLFLDTSLDKAFYLAFLAPRQLETKIDQVRKRLKGITLNIAIAPADDIDGDTVDTLDARGLIWELVSVGEEGEPIYLPLDVVADSSKGGRQSGVVRLRLPHNTDLFESFYGEDPMFGGLGTKPPDLATEAEQARVVFWLRLRCPEQPKLSLGYLGVNGLEVAAQGRKTDVIVGVGNGRPDQFLALPHQQIDADSLELDVEEDGVWVTWRQVPFLAGQAPDARVYRLDADSGCVYFGDGISAGRRPPMGKRIRAAVYLFGGGAKSNLPADSIKEIVDGSPRLTVRQEQPLKGGVDAETVTEAEKRIPQFLTHRNRAVTPSDFKLLTETNPAAKVARAEVLKGFLPGPNIKSVRENVPGVVSVFVLPPGTPALLQTPKPTRGLLKDVFAYLLERVTVGTELYVLSPEFVPIAVSVAVHVLDKETEQETLRAVQEAIVRYLWPVAPGGAQGSGWPMGATGTVRANELMTQAARVEGVLSVNGLALFSKNTKGWRRLNEKEAVQLKTYQLPELMGIRVASGTGTPKPPGAIGALVGEKPASDVAVPVPVIPHVC